MLITENPNKPVLPYERIMAFTGHRPDKLGGYQMNSSIVDSIRVRIMEELIRYRPRHIISGMALGIDQLVARMALNIGIPFTAAIPFNGQEKNWPLQAQREYASLIACAHQVVNVSGKDYYKPEFMQQRNKWMVDNCHRLIGVWNDTPGGTANCIAYAREILQPDQIIIINPAKICSI